MRRLFFLNLNAVYILSIACPIILIQLFTLTGFQRDISGWIELHTATIDELIIKLKQITP